MDLKKKLQIAMAAKKVMPKGPMAPMMPTPVPTPMPKGFGKKK